MGRSERDDLFLEAISAGIRGQRVDWEPLEPQLSAETPAGTEEKNEDEA